MLFEITTILLALLLPISAFFSFRTGYRTGRAVEKKEDLKPAFHVPKGKDVLTEEQQRFNKILSNIEVYDGSTEGQVKV